LRRQRAASNDFHCSAPCVGRSVCHVSRYAPPVLQTYGHNGCASACKNGST
jgi:hypothetical protein